MSGTSTTPVPVLPDAWAARGVRLREERADDKPFLQRLFASVRQQEMDLSAWPPALREQFLRSQFELQSLQYATLCSASERLLIVLGQEPMGRLYLRCSNADIHVVDLSLMPSCRGAGLGTALLIAMQEQALTAGKRVTLSVAATNPAQRLYRRLGFVESGQQPPYLHMAWAPPA
ncbi:GNAT family N-acetyltransferase [Pseudomonas silvicola]|nr:GNAT family N-acetyltransferase [Pseudomonas silvicola]